MKSRLVVSCFSILLALGFALPAAAWQAPETLQQEISADSLDRRWLPWLGCWELVADAVDYREVEQTGRRVVCVAPRLDGLGVNLTTQIDAAVIAENTVIADGVERPLPRNDCAGTQSAAWSANGRRVVSSVSASCADAGHATQGLSMLVSSTRWVELQSVTANDEHQELVIRHYDRLNDAATTALGYATLDARSAARAASSRAGAAAPLSVDDVIEIRADLPNEVVEAAIVESESTFNLDADSLVRLVDAGVDERTIDLMVAVSFPDEFIVDHRPSGGGGAGSGGYIGVSSYYYPPPPCWGNYYSPFYGPYGPSCGGWRYGSPYYGGYYPPSYVGRRTTRQRPPKVGPQGSLYGGRVIGKRGYAAPRRAGGTSGTAPGVRSGDASTAPEATPVYRVRRAVQRDEGGGGGSGLGSTIKRSIRGGGSVSPKGYNNPSGSSSSTPRRSSAGAASSGSGKAQVKAKPKGGSAPTKKPSASAPRKAKAKAKPKKPKGGSAPVARPAASTPSKVKAKAKPRGGS